MTQDLVTFTPEREIVDAMTILIDRHLSGAPVLDETGKLVGVLSKKDCLRAAVNASYYQQWGGKVSDFMTINIQTLDADLDVMAATQAFLTSPYRRFPVTSNGELVGQISRIDLLRSLSDLWK
jgi:CBS domain-containing protein